MFKLLLTLFSVVFFFFFLVFMPLFIELLEADWITIGDHSSCSPFLLCAVNLFGHFYFKHQEEAFQ